MIKEYKRNQKYRREKKKKINPKNIKNKPTAILAKTIKGKGVDFMENNASWHGKSPNDEEYAKALEQLLGG